MIPGWKVETLADDATLGHWLPGKGRRFLVLIIYQDEACFRGIETYGLPRSDVRVMLNDPDVKERAAKHAKSYGATDVLCLVTTQPGTVDDFMNVRRESGPPRGSLLDLWMIYDRKKMQFESS